MIRQESTKIKAIYNFPAVDGHNNRAIRDRVQIFCYAYFQQEKLYMFRLRSFILTGRFCGFVLDIKMTQ